MREALLGRRAIGGVQRALVKLPQSIGPSSRMSNPYSNNQIPLKNKKCKGLAKRRRASMGSRGERLLVEMKDQP
jgi:hypothetical protein